MPNLIIGSRGSKLALWQSNWVKAELERLHDGLTVAIEIIKTTGDKLTEASLARMPGKGVFTKEIEEALYERRVDLAVHSLKDLPTTLPDGLHLSAITKREDPRDALLVSRRLRARVNSIMSLPVQPRIGTSSPRRAAQLRHLRPDAQIFELRGNIDTRLRKLDEGDFDAIILAASGLLRLGLGSWITQIIPVNQLLPAVGQGALGIEARVEDERTNLLLESLNHWPTRFAVEAERALLRGLGGGCAVPIAAFGQVDSASETTPLRLEGLVCNLSGTRIIRHDVTGSQYKSEELGNLLARHLIADGANELLAEQDLDAKQKAESSSAPASPPANIPRIETNAERFARMTEPRQPMPERTAVDETVNEAVSQATSEPESAGAPLPPAAPVTVSVVEADDSNRTSSPTSLPTARPSSKEISAERFPRRKEAPPKTLPLAGKRIIVTRARHQADALTHVLAEHGAEVIECPTIEIRPPDSWRPLDEAMKRLGDYQWLVFTSSNAVNYFLRRFDETGHTRAELAALKICAVGKKTAEKLQEEKLQVDLTPDRFTAENLVAAFIRKFGVGQRMRGTSMLLPAAQITRDVIRPTLEKLGITVDVVEAYQNVLPEVSSEEIVTLINQSSPDYAIFTSPSTVNNLAILMDSDDLSQHLPDTRIACIGPVTAKAAEQCGLTVHILPDEHTTSAIVERIIQDNTV